MVIKETTNSKFIFHRGRIHSCSFMCMPDNMVKKGVRKAESESRQVNYYLQSN